MHHLRLHLQMFPLMYVNSTIHDQGIHFSDTLETQSEMLDLNEAYKHNAVEYPGRTFRGVHKFVHG